jgi:hypothetical protein
MKFVDCSIEINTSPEKIIQSFTHEQMLKG